MVPEGQQPPTFSGDEGGSPPGGHESPGAGPGGGRPLAPTRIMAIELLVVIGLAVVPDLVNALASLVYHGGPVGYGVTAAYGITRSVMVSGVVLYLMWRSPEGLGGFGLRRVRPVVDAALAVGLFMVLWGSHYVLWNALGVVPGLIDLYNATAPAEIQAIFPPPATALDLALIVAMSLANGFAEQLVISAYLVTRIHALTGHPAAAIGLASVLFTSYHVYQGLWALPSVLVFGLICTTVFFLTRRLWPLALAHGLVDIVAFTMPGGV